MKTKQNMRGTEENKGTRAESDRELSESSLAVAEFASLVKGRASHSRKSISGENYEVHPCKRVRGYVLRLPVLGWTLWYPTVPAALAFAEKLARIHLAECCVYDAKGSLDSRRSFAATPPGAN
jgi:hypothetical protein